MFDQVEIYYLVNLNVDVWSGGDILLCESKCWCLIRWRYIIWYCGLYCSRQEYIFKKAFNEFIGNSDFALKLEGYNTVDSIIITLMTCLKKS